MAKSSIQELVSAVAEKYGLSQKDAETFITVAFSAINDGLRDDKVVKVKGLGTFKVIDVRDRESVNVNTGERVLIEGHGKITFTPDPIMRDFVNKPFSQFDTVIINDGVDIKEFDTVAGENFDADNTDAGDIQSENTKNEDVNIAGKSEPIATETVDDVLMENTGAGEYNQGDEDVTPLGVDNNIDRNLETCTISDESDDTEHEVVTIPLPETELPENISEFDDVSTSGCLADNERIEEPFIGENGTDEEYSETEPSEIRSSSNSVHRKIFFIITTFIVAFGCIVAGYYLGRYQTPPNVVVKYVKVNPSVVIPDTANNKGVKENQDSVIDDKNAETLNDKKNPDISKEIQSDKEAAENKDYTGTGKDRHLSQSLKNAKAIVSSGAYRIVGTDRVVTVKKGETLEKISKFYLGPGMECYIQVYNNTDVVKEGMSLKIPKLLNKRN